MADDKEIELDDFDFDDFDFNDFDMSGPDGADDRSPTTAIRDSAIADFRSSISNKDTIRRALEDSLPSGYESTFDTLDAVGDTRDKIKEAMEPVADQAKLMARQNKDLVNKFLPKKMAERLSGWSEAEDVSGGYEDLDPRKAEVTASVADIFRLNQEREKEERQVDTEAEGERFAIKEEAEAKRHMSQVEVLDAIRSGISRQTDYQDQILSRYQQKHLELTYQQLYTVQDILELNKRRAESDTQSFADIVKNTALPETQKIRGFEEAKREAYAEARREAVEGVGGYMRGAVSGMVGNTINSVQTRLLDTMGMVQEYAGASDGMGPSPQEMIGGLLGTEAADGILRKGIETALKATGQDADDSYVNRLAARLSLMWQEAPEKLISWARTSSGAGGVAGFLENFIKDQVPRFGRVNTIDVEQIADADEAATFTNRIARSITDVIPGYLSLQLHQLRLLVSDGEPVERIEYNPETGQFGAASDKSETLKQRLFGAASDRYKRNMKDVTTGLVGESSLSDEQMEEFEDFLYDHLSQGESAEIKELSRYAKRSRYMSDETKEVVSKLLMENYDSEGKHFADVDLNNATTDTYKAIGRIRDSMPSFKEDMEHLLSAGYRDELMDMGLVDHKGRIDHDVVASHLNGRPISKRGQDGTFKDRVATGNRDISNDDNVAVHGVSDTRTDMEERGGASFWDKITKKTSRPSDAGRSDEIVQAITGASKEQVDQLSALIEGQSDQTQQIIQHLSKSTNQPIGDVERLFTAQTDALREAIEACCVKEESKEQVELLKNIMAIIPESVVLSGGPSERSGSILKSITRRVGTVAKTGSDLLETYFRGAFSVMGKVVDGASGVAKPIATGAGSLLGSIGKRLTRGREAVGDLYVRGKERGRAVIEESKLKAGEYFDQATGKPVFTVEDIRKAKGAIVDKADNVKVSVEDLAEGLETKKGESVISKGVDFLKRYYSALWGGVTNVASLIPPAVRGAYGMVRNILDREVDLYVKGEVSPRILASLLRKGHYRDQASGEAIYSRKDIEGTIVDPEGRVVLAMEDLEKVVGPDGKPIKTLMEKGINLMKRYYGAVWGATLKAGRWAKDTVGGLVKGKVSFGGGASEEHENTVESYWEEQLKILRRLDVKFTGGAGPEFAGDTPTRPTGGGSGGLALPAPASDTSSENVDADFSTPAPDQDVGRAGSSSGLKDKFTDTLGSIKDSIGGFFSKRKEAAEADDENEEKQTGLLSKLTNLTRKRSEKQDEVQQAQIESQKKMTETLEGIRENTDKEEVRKGGWMERLKGKKGDGASGDGSEEDSEPKLGKQSKRLGYDEKSPVDMLLGGFGSILGEFGDTLKTALAGLTGWLGSKLLSKFKGGTDVPVRPGGGTPPRPDAPKKGLWQGIKRFGGKALKFGARALPYVGMLGSGLLTAAGAVGSVLASPVVIGAAVVAGVAYGGYKLYQYATSYKPKVLDTLRFAHYGLNIKTEKYRKLILPLEAYLEDNLSWVDGRPKIDYDPNDPTLAKMLGMGGEDTGDIDGQNAYVWFQRRFLPAWGAHRAILHNAFDDKVTLDKIDDLKEEQKEEFLDAVGRGVDSSIFGDMTSPYYDDALEFNVEKVKALHMWALDEIKKKKKAIPVPGRNSVLKSPTRDEDGNAQLYTVKPGYDDPKGSSTTPGSSKGGGSYWGGASVKEMLNLGKSANKAKTPYTLSIVRHKQTRKSTISNATLTDKATGQTVLSFKMLERPGPDTREREQRMRIPEGSYKLKWQTQTGLAGVRPHLPVPWLYGSGVPEDRHIYIHNGNYPQNTDGCLLCGKDEGVDMVTSSVDTLDRLKSELMQIGIENVTVDISSSYSGKAPKAPQAASDLATSMGYTHSVPETPETVNAKGEDDGRGAGPLNRPSKASEREESVLSNVPKEWVTKEEIDESTASTFARYPGKSVGELSTLRDIELTRLVNRRKQDWMAENGVSTAAAKAAGLIGDGSVQSFGGFAVQQSSTTYRVSTPMSEERPADEDQTRSPVIHSAMTDQEHEEIRAAQRDKQARMQTREDAENRKRIEQGRRQAKETTERIESVLSEQLATQRRMDNHLEKLVLLAEGRFEEETNKSPTEYLVKRGYKPPQGVKEAFKPVVDLSS